MKIAGLCLALCSVACATAASAQDIPERLSLGEALRIADERSPVLGPSRALVAVAAADKVIARTRPNPAFSFDSEGYHPFTAQPRGFINAQELSFRVEQEIETAGRVRLRKATADAAQKSAEASLEDERRRLHLEVQRAYFQMVLAIADRDAAKASLEEIDAIIAVNRTRLAQGEISGGELRRVEVERLRFMDDVFGAELALKNARSALLALLNAPRLDLPVEATETLAFAAGSPAARGPEAGAGGMDFSSLSQEAFAKRPDLAAARGDEARAATETRLQRALRTPNITVGGGYHRDFGASGIAFTLTVPLPVFNTNAGGVARAEAERTLAESRMAATRVAVALDVQQAMNAVETNRARVAYIEKEYLGNARAARDIVQTSYKEGESDLTDFLDAQRAFRETQRTYNRALYDYRISLFQLDAAVGR